MAVASIPPRHCLEIRRRLLAWFGRRARPLPWRRTRDPYAIWISEVMLQQTQVATVIVYYQRFLKAFPTVSALARADLQAVLRHWQGLGYYRRARDLHEAARLMHAEHDGQVPDDPESLGALPGMGRYSVNAVLSQAFERRLPILEANSQRVLCRLLGVRADPRSGTIRRTLWDAAERLLPIKHVGQFNQALMELGALVCVPASPRCSECPIRGTCRAYRDNLQHAIPRRQKGPLTIAVQEVGLVIRRRDRVLLAQRSAQARRWANLWEFPHHELEAGETHAQAGQRLLRSLGIEAALGPEIAAIRHGITRFRIDLRCLEARHQRGRFRASVYSRAEWVLPEDVRQYPVSSPQRRLADKVIDLSR
jgi:A/G-specific adenine glycosylase